MVQWLYHCSTKPDGTMVLWTEIHVKRRNKLVSMFTSKKLHVYLSWLPRCLHIKNTTAVHFCKRNTQYHYIKVLYATRGIKRHKIYWILFICLSIWPTELAPLLLSGWFPSPWPYLKSRTSNLTVAARGRWVVVTGWASSFLPFWCITWLLYSASPCIAGSSSHTCTAAGAL